MPTHLCGKLGLDGSWMPLNPYGTHDHLPVGERCSSCLHTVCRESPPPDIVDLTSDTPTATPQSGRTVSTMTSPIPIRSSGYPIKQEIKQETPAIKQETPAFSGFHNPQIQGVQGTIGEYNRQKACHKTQIQDRTKPHAGVNAIANRSNIKDHKSSGVKVEVFAMNIDIAEFYYIPPAPGDYGLEYVDSRSYTATGEVLRIPNQKLDQHRKQKHFIEILENVKPMLKKHTRRPDATRIWIAQNMKSELRGKPPKTPCLTFTDDHWTVADVYKSLIKRGNVGQVHLVADILYIDPEEESGDSEDKLDIKEEATTPTPTKGRKSQKTPTPKAGRKYQTKGKTLPKSKPSPRIKKEPVSTSKQSIVKQGETTPPIEEKETTEYYDDIFTEEDGFSDGEEHLGSQSPKEDVSDEVLPPVEELLAEPKPTQSPKAQIQKRPASSSGYVPPAKSTRSHGPPRPLADNA